MELALFPEGQIHVLQSEFRKSDHPADNLRRPLNPFIAMFEHTQILGIKSSYKTNSELVEAVRSRHSPAQDKKTLKRTAVARPIRQPIRRHRFEIEEILDHRTAI